MAPSALTLQKTHSSMNYTSKKARSQNWYNQFKQHKKIDTEMLLKGFDLRKESKSFLLTIKSLSNIPMRDIQGENQTPVVGAKYNLEYHITLFNRDVGGTGSFYGRTYRGKPLPLREAGGSWEVTQEEFVFFHTSYTEKTSYAIIESVIVKDLGGIKSYGSVGYGLCTIFDFVGVTTVELIRGSPRSIGQVGLDATQSKSQKALTKLTFEMRDFPSFDKLKQLIPMNCFCGATDIIPGLVNDVLPPPRSGPQGNLGGAQVNLQFIPKTTLYIHNLQMLSSIALENRFENFLRKMKKEKTKTARGSINTDQTDNVYISERRIIVQANNSWKNITEDTYVSMGPPNEKGVSQSGGSLTIKNFICHPLVSLIFRIEYKAIIPTDKYNEQVFFTLGWCVHLPSFNAAGELSDETVEADFELGPGQSPSGDLLWDPNADDINYYQIKMRAQVSTSAQAPYSSYQDGPAGQNKVLGRNNNNMSLPTKMTNLNEEQQRAFLDKEKQIKQLEDRLNLQKKNEMEQYQRVEQLELMRMQDPNGQQNSYDKQYEDQIRLVQMQKDQLTNELFQMRNDMKTYVESMRDATMLNPNQSHYGQQNQYGQQTQYGQQNQYPTNYGDAFSQQIQQPLSSNSSQQIAMIGNVFYNMLNMIGESEKDKRIIGLSDNLKKMVQQQKFDDLLAPVAPYVGMGAVNLLKTTDLPLTDQINFIKMGFGDMLQHPSAQITSSSIMKDRLSLELEAADSLKACTLTFKFICLKAPFSGIENMPSRFYFQLKFFTFPSVLTDKVKIVSPGDPSSKTEIRPNQSYYLSKETHLGNYGKLHHTEQSRDTMQDPNLLSITFEIDPSISRIKDENIKLAEYLRERFLTVDVFDGDSLFLYGTCKIPLFELLRQGRGSVVRAKECEMCHPDNGDFRGSIQLIMSNQGRVQSVTESEVQKQIDRESPQKSRMQPSQTENSAKKGSKYKKVVKSRPMDLTKQQQTNSTNNMASTHGGLATSQNFNQNLLSQMDQNQVSQVSMQNADLRKKLRVDRVRKMTMGQTSSQASVEDPTQPDWAKFKSLREIEMIRETKKGSILNQVMNEYVTGAQQLAIIPGQLEFLTIPIHNPFNQNEVFTIHINDPDEPFLSAKELMLVNDQAEWRHWVAQGKAKKPKAWDVLTPAGDLILKPNDEIDLLFKFITVREASNNPHSKSTSELIRPRKIQIIIMQSNRQPYQTLEINVVPSSSPIDHTFRYYEPQNSHISLLIPPFIQLNHPGLTAVVSRPTATVEINKQSSIVQLETKTEDAPNITEMTLFIYGDQFRQSLLATCKIEIYALVTIYTKIKAGVQSIQTLSLPAENARTVMIHSSNTKSVYLPKRVLNQTFKIIPQTINHIQVCAKTYMPTQQKVRIHCTDAHTGELVYAWLMLIDSERPTVTKKHEVTCKVNQASVQSLEFTNKLNLRTVFEFASSREDFISPKVEAVTFESRESKLVDLYFPPQPRYGTADVYLYASDIEQHVVECHLLRIAYLP